MSRILRHRVREKDVRFGNLRVPSIFLADDLVLLVMIFCTESVSSKDEFYLWLETMVLQVAKFNYLCFLFTNQDSVELEMDSWFGVSWSVIVCCSEVTAEAKTKRLKCIAPTSKPHLRA